MIKIDRSVHPNPLNDEQDYVHEFLSEYRSYPDLGSRRNDLQRLKTRINRLAREPLQRVFNGKCAFCESSLDATSSENVDRFRPINDATDLSGSGDPGYYTWLFAEWENLFITCNACSRSKRSMFPVAGSRAKWFATYEETKISEEPLLIDPCNIEPREHLVFTEEGLVLALSDKGETTIKVFSLNRMGLVRARRAVWERVSAGIAQGTNVQALTAEFSPHSAVARAASDMLTAPNSEIQDRIRRSQNVLPDRRSADKILADDEDAYRLTVRTLRRVEISNFKLLRSASLDFGEQNSERSPWLVLLGENSTGKSTFLQAVALTLAGAMEARRLVRPDEVLSAGASEGWVKVWFWDRDYPIELHFRQGLDLFHGPSGPSAIVLGYGAVRYAERKRRQADQSPRFSRVQALIDPIAKIRFSGGWFSELDEKRFAVAQSVLQSVLPDDKQSTVVERDKRRVVFNVGGHRGPLSELSAGYQTIIGICADIMRLLFERWDTVSSATGIVLIDEIDAHLHPRWAMRIASAFREAFPQVQFIASTHNPLVLRGLRNGEVALLRRDGEEVVLDQYLPPLEGLPVDELLTSRVFGLNSTMDPETEARLNEYYHLLSLPKTEQHDARIQELREAIGDREALGRNARERLMLEAADRFIQETNNSPDRNRTISADTQTIVSKLIRDGFDRARGK